MAVFGGEYLLSVKFPEFPLFSVLGNYNKMLQQRDWRVNFLRPEKINDSLGMSVNVSNCLVMSFWNCIYVLLYGFI